MSKLMDEIEQLKEGKKEKEIANDLEYAHKRIDEIAATGGFMVSLAKTNLHDVKKKLESEGYCVTYRNEFVPDYDTGGVFDKWIALDVHWEYPKKGIKAKNSQKIAQKCREKVIKKFHECIVPQIKEKIKETIQKSCLCHIEYKMGIIEAEELKKEGFKLTTYEYLGFYRKDYNEAIKYSIIW